MEVDVRHRRRLAREARLVEVVDVARRLVEQVEDLQGQGETGGEVVAATPSMSEARSVTWISS